MELQDFNMQKEYGIFLGGKKIGFSLLEYGDVHMGVVYGKIISIETELSYQFIKDFCETKGLALTIDYTDDKMISTSMEELKVLDSEEKEINGVWSQIEGMDSEGFHITVAGIDGSFYEKEFPHHIEEYQNRFQEK